MEKARPLYVKGNIVEVKREVAPESLWRSAVRLLGVATGGRNRGTFMAPIEQKIGQEKYIGFIGLFYQ
jgi:hypothetical protein